MVNPRDTFSVGDGLHLSTTRNSSLVIQLFSLKTQLGRYSLELGICRKSGKVTEKAVMDAVELAVKNMAFEVLYYPRANWFDFVVDANVVDDAMKISWTSGIQVKLPLKKEESSNSKMRLFQPQGTISDVSNAPSNVPNWRMLQVHTLSSVGLIIFQVHNVI